MRTTLMILVTATWALAFIPVPAAAKCTHSFCGPTTRTITNEHRQKVGDIYNPGHGRRLQIRDNRRRIIGYIERNGTITNTRRQKVGTIK